MSTFRQRALSILHRRTTKMSLHGGEMPLHTERLAPTFPSFHLALHVILPQDSTHLNKKSFWPLGEQYSNRDGKALHCWKPSWFYSVHTASAVLQSIYCYTKWKSHCIASRHQSKLKLLNDHPVCPLYNLEHAWHALSSTHTRQQKSKGSEWSPGGCNANCESNLCTEATGRILGYFN